MREFPAAPLLKVDEDFCMYNQPTIIIISSLPVIKLVRHFKPEIPGFLHGDPLLSLFVEVRDLENMSLLAGVEPLRHIFWSFPLVKSKRKGCNHTSSCSM